MDEAFIEILRCPTTHQPLRWLTAEEAAAMGLPARAGLITANGKFYYPLDDHGFPAVLPEAATAVPDRERDAEGPARPPA